jgi:hypothetical protein
MDEQSSVVKLVETLRSSPLFPVCEGGREFCGKVFSVHARVYEHAAHYVRVDVGTGPSVLDVALASGVGGRCWDAEGGRSVTNTVGEFVDCLSIEGSSQSVLVIVAVHGDVISVLSCELFHHLVDVFHATVACTHSLRREVCVATRATPALEELGGEGNGHVEVLSDAQKNVARDPVMVSNGDSLDGTNLVLPLSGEGFSVGA